MTREAAVKEIEKAFEPAYANYIVTALTEGATVSDKEPTTKNDLGVDCISRIETIDYLCKHCPDDGECFKDCDEIKHLRQMPSVTPQELFINKPCVSSGVCEHDKNKVLNKIDEIITDALDKSTDQKESQTLRWVLDKISEVEDENDD